MANKNATTPETPDGLAKLASFIAEQERKPLVVSVTPGAALLVPEGYTARDIKPILDAFRTRPEQRAGTTELTDLASFIAWTTRHQDAGSVIYADDNMSSPSLTAVIDHDEAGPDTPDTVARWGRHRGIYKFPFSREWQEWTAACRPAGLNASDFAAFFERRIGDVAPPPYSMDNTGAEVLMSQDPEIRKLVVDLGKRFATVADIVKLTRGVEINVDSKASVTLNRDTGEHHIDYSEVNGAGADRIKPPSAFLIAIPVLHNGIIILIAVHLRYRARDGKVTWFLELHHPERVFEEVFTQALATVGTDTGFTPLRGKAPAAR